LPQPSQLRLRESPPAAPAMYSAAEDRVLAEPPTTALPPRSPTASLRAPFGRGQARLAPDDERWRRIVIAPGVELHLREPLDDRAHQAIDHLRRLFDEA
jgi:hypothetical protein